MERAHYYRPDRATAVRGGLRVVAHAAMLLQKLMAERPADLAVRLLAERLLSMRKSDRSPT